MSEKTDMKALPRFVRSKNAIAQNSRTQAAMTPQKFLRTWCDCSIHPVAGAAFFGSMKLNALDFKILPNQSIEINPTDENISPDTAWLSPLNLKGATKLVEDFERKKCDLPLVIISVIEKSITPNASPHHALNGLHLDGCVVVGFAAVMADEIVTGRNVKMTDFHRLDDIITV